MDVMVKRIVLPQELKTDFTPSFYAKFETKANEMNMSAVAQHVPPALLAVTVSEITPLSAT